MTRTRTAVLMFALAGSGCTGGGTSAGRQPEASAQPSDHAEPAKAPPVEGPEAHAGTAEGGTPAGGQNWEIAATPQAPFRAGAEGRVEVRLSGRNGYHVNQEYPIELNVTPPAGVTLTKARLRRPDASAFEEARAVFPVAFTSAAAGHKEFSGELSFSVCNPQNCLLEREPVTFAVDVE